MISEDPGVTAEEADERLLKIAAPGLRAEKRGETSLSNVIEAVSLLMGIEKIRECVRWGAEDRQGKDLEISFRSGVKTVFTEDGKAEQEQILEWVWNQEGELLAAALLLELQILGYLGIKSVFIEVKSSDHGVERFRRAAGRSEWSEEAIDKVMANERRIVLNGQLDQILIQESFLRQLWRVVGARMGR